MLAASLGMRHNPELEVSLGENFIKPTMRLLFLFSTRFQVPAIWIRNVVGTFSVAAKVAGALPRISRSIGQR